MVVEVVVVVGVVVDVVVLVEVEVEDEVLLVLEAVAGRRGSSRRFAGGSRAAASWAIVPAAWLRFAAQGGVDRDRERLDVAR